MNKIRKAIQEQAENLEMDKWIQDHHGNNNQVRTTIRIQPEKPVER